MTERWRKPVIPIAIEPESRTVVTIGESGNREFRTFKDYQFILKDEDVERLRQGYVCINCQEPFETPFPERCIVCDFPCKERQAEVFARSYEGWEPPLTPLSDKVAALDEADDKKAHIPGKSIWLPRGVDP